MNWRERDHVVPIYDAVAILVSSLSHNTIFSTGFTFRFHSSKIVYLSYSTHGFRVLRLHRPGPTVCCLSLPAGAIKGRPHAAGAASFPDDSSGSGPGTARLSDAVGGIPRPSEQCPSSHLELGRRDHKENLLCRLEQMA